MNAGTEVEEKYTEEEEEEVRLRLINVIFLPFHPAVRAVVLFVVAVKCFLGPPTSVFPVIMCEIEKLPAWIQFILKVYQYADFVFCLDIFLHILHRQVADEAAKREFAPKTALCLTLDIMSAIPFFLMLSAETGGCPATRLWPNIAGFTETLCFYRIVQFFDMKDSHSFVKILIGYLILYMFIINTLACLVTVLTVNGFCKACQNNVYDWRMYLIQKYPYISNGHNLLFFTLEYVGSIMFNMDIDEFKPGTYWEYVLSVCLMAVGFTVRIYLVGPKLFCEEVLRKKRLAIFHAKATQILEETEARSPFVAETEEFHSLIWTKMQGVCSRPKLLKRLPRYIKLQMEQDIAWPVFHHSPTLRKTSTSYKRWMYHNLELEFKTPGERYFAGQHCYSHLYYLKSGTIQFLSAEDGMTPILSVSGGTIFGDISFCVPPLHRRCIVRCLTYCEIIKVPRSVILLSMYKFPEDRCLIRNLARERIEHARRLYGCKERIRGKDRAEDEGIKWLKDRWWQISRVLASWKKASKKDAGKCRLPAEARAHHCARHIGQLVLCRASQLRVRAIFSRVEFPWLLAENSSLKEIWNRIIICIACMVVLIYPPNLAKSKTPTWFSLFRWIVDISYVFDVLITLLTSPDTDTRNASIKTIFLKKFKSFWFIVDIVAVTPLETIAALFGGLKYYEICQFNRLLKVHKVIFRTYRWQRRSDPLNRQMINAMVAQFASVYVFAYVCYLSPRLITDLKSIQFWFGPSVCLRDLDTKCDQDREGALVIAYYFVFEYLVGSSSPQVTREVEAAFFTYCVLFFLKTYVYCKILSIWYLKSYEAGNYTTLVAGASHVLAREGLRGGVAARAARYWRCQWRRERGVRLLHPARARAEPHSVYWASHGAAAERLLAAAPALGRAPNALRAELARRARFALVPPGFVLELFGMHSECITWLVRGELKCEYKNEAGELVSFFERPTDILSISAILPGVPCLRTYTSATDCEILYITRKDFEAVMKGFPEEWQQLATCAEHVLPLFDELFHKYLMQHQTFQKKIRERIFNDRKSVAVLASRKAAKTKRDAQIAKEDTEKTEGDTGKTKLDAGEADGHVGEAKEDAGKTEENVEKAEEDAGAAAEAREPPTSLPFGTYINDPEAPFIKFWMVLRACTVVFQVLTTAMRAFVLHLSWKHYNLSVWVGHLAAVFDITISFVLPYYDARGVAVRARGLCARHYAGRGLVLDLLGTLPAISVSRLLLAAPPPYHDLVIIANLIKLAHLYRLNGCLDYFIDTPFPYRIYVILLKWQFMIFLIGLSISNIFFRNCVNIIADANDKFVRSESRNGTCWSYVVDGLIVNEKIREYSLLIIFSLDLAQNAMLGFSLNEYKNYGEGLWMTWLVYLAAFFAFWSLTTYCQALLVVAMKGDTVFQHGLAQLVRFLRHERVPRALLDRCLRHYNYQWVRTHGADLPRTYDSIGDAVGLKQDINLCIYKGTFEALNSVVCGGSLLERRLAGLVRERRLLAGEHQQRQRHLAPAVCLVHRGTVAVERNGRAVTTLTRGCIFGQLWGAAPRPAGVTVRAQEHSDLLEVPYKEFQASLSEESKKILASTPGYRFDFLKLRKERRETAQFSIEYITRGAKVIKLPWLGAVHAASSRRYAWLLAGAWLWNTSGALLLCLLLQGAPPALYHRLRPALWPLDFIHFVYYLSEFFVMELRIVNNKCVYRYVGWRRLLDVGFYLDTLSLVMPVIGLLVDKNYDLYRFLRIYLFVYYYNHFCRDFQNTYSPILLKVVSLVVLVNSLACLWMMGGCERFKGYHFKMHKDAPKFIFDSIDADEWRLVDDLRDARYACVRMTPKYNGSDGRQKHLYVMAKRWIGSYVSGLALVMSQLTATHLIMFHAFSVRRTCYKLFIGLVTFWSRMWITAATISYFYTNSHDLYMFAYKAESLKTYFKANGVPATLLETMSHYLKQLWKKQKGSAIPKFAELAPPCLREDIFTSLYMHHFNNLPLFSILPDYFLKQLVVRVKRKTIFPGNFIVQEGDIHPTMFFIHEGEVERWCTDAKGEAKMASVLTMNSHFGVLCGVYPNFPYQYSYYSRTVVDLILLAHGDWQELLAAYPEVRRRLLGACATMRREVRRKRAEDAAAPDTAHRGT